MDVPLEQMAQALSMSKKKLYLDTHFEDFPNKQLEKKYITLFPIEISR